MVNFTHIAALCLVEASKLYIRATKHKVNMYDEYLTRPNNCVSIWSSLPNAKERQNLEQQMFENGLTVALCNVGATLIHTSLHIFRFII